ncbi:MAG: Smr/MutS family protein [Paracoccaceae bacterium]
MRRGRRLTASERALWDAVAARTQRRRAPATLAEPAAPPKAQTAPAPPKAQTAPAPPPAPKAAPIPQFRVGERARPGGAPMPPSKGPPQAPTPALRMDAKAHRRLRRGKLEPEDRIDLHGMTLDEAHPALMSFVLGARMRGLRTVLVITGKAGRLGAGGPGAWGDRPRGVLRHQVPRWLALPPLRGAVLQVVEAHRSHGGAGALYVHLSR